MYYFKFPMHLRKNSSRHVIRLCLLQSDNVNPQLTELVLFDCSCGHVCGDEAGVAPAAPAVVHARSHWLRVLAGFSKAPPPHPQAPVCQQM